MIYIELFNWICSAHEYTEKICYNKCSRWEEKDAQQIVYRKILWRKHYFGMTGSWTGSGTLVSLIDSSDRKPTHHETVHCGIYQPLAVRDLSETDLTDFLCVLITFYTTIYSLEGHREEERQSQQRPRWIGCHVGFQRKWLWAKWRPCNEGKIHSTQQSVFQVVLKMQPHKPCDLEQNDLLCDYCAPSRLCCCSLAGCAAAAWHCWERRVLVAIWREPKVFMPW